MTLTLTGYRARPSPSPSPGTYACERCGITRPHRRGRLCRDCRDTDPRWETAWRAEQSPLKGTTA